MTRKPVLAVRRSVFGAGSPLSAGWKASLLACGPVFESEVRLLPAERRIPRVERPPDKANASFLLAETRLSAGERRLLAANACGLIASTRLLRAETSPLARAREPREPRGPRA